MRCVQMYIFGIDEHANMAVFCAICWMLWLKNMQGENRSEYITRRRWFNDTTYY